MSDQKLPPVPTGYRPDVPPTSESVRAPRRQYLRGTGTTDFATPGRGFILNAASQLLHVKLSGDAAAVLSYYIQGVQYVCEVVNVQRNNSGSPAALSAAGDVTILE